MLIWVEGGVRVQPYYSFGRLYLSPPTGVYSLWNMGRQTLQGKLGSLSPKSPAVAALGGVRVSDKLARPGPGR